MTIDTTSPPGSWEREWDARSHSETEYRNEIRELRARVRAYLAEIERLRAENDELRAANARWVMEP